MSEIHPFKREIYQLLEEKLRLKIEQLELDLIGISESKAGDSKSSAGDKFETSREMLAQEQQRLMQQLAELRSKEITLQRLMQSEKSSDTVQLGSLVRWGGNWILIGIPEGALSAPSLKVMCISADAPLFQILKGKKAGDTAQHQQKSVPIEEVL